MLKQVLFDNQIWEVVSSTDRNKDPEEAIPGIILIGTILHLRSTTTGEECKAYPWDVWGLEVWENLDGTCDESKVPEYLKGG